MTTRIALLSRIVGADARALERLRDADIEVVIRLAEYESLVATPEGVREWHRILATLDGLVIGLHAIDAPLLEAATRLRYVLRIGTGLDAIDVTAAEARGVEIATLAGMNAPAVAEFAFALLLAAAKRLPEIDAMVREGGWQRVIGHQLSGNTLGLIGFGEIAQAMVAKAHGFGMEVLVYRRHPNAADDLSFGVRTVELDELIRSSQFISVHAPLTPETHHLIGAAEIGLMSGTVLVNTSRGGLIDEAALLTGLTQGRVAAAALDVLVEEPPLSNPLIGLPNVLVTSHTAGHTDVVNASIAAAAADFILARPTESEVPE